MRRIRDEFNCPQCGAQIGREIGVFTDDELRASVAELTATLKDFREFAIRETVKWTLEGSQHNPIWQRVAGVLSKHGAN